MKRHVMILMGVFFAMSWCNAIAGDTCYIDFGPFDCTPLLDESCPAEGPCFGNELILSGVQGNELLESETGGWLGDGVMELECFTMAPCVSDVNLETLEYFCLPNYELGFTENVIDGYLNWDMECQP